MNGTTAGGRHESSQIKVQPCTRCVKRTRQRDRQVVVHPVYTCLPAIRAAAASTTSRGRGCTMRSFFDTLVMRTGQNAGNATSSFPNRTGRDGANRAGIGVRRAKRHPPGHGCESLAGRARESDGTAPKNVHLFDGREPDNAQHLLGGVLDNACVRHEDVREVADANERHVTGVWKLRVLSRALAGSTKRRFVVGCGQCSLN
eukprot:scaffold3451_cov116-Isochrysis_galbana.AAC.2